MLLVEHISVNYGETRILRDVSLEVPPGQVVCLLGRNGVGKTTLLKSIMGVLKLREGDITFDGQPITRWPSFRRARAGIGYVPQGRGIFPYLSVNENLLMGLEAGASRRAAGSAVAEMFELFPVLYTMRGRVAGTLSGGQQQQLALARALVSRPRLLLLDEPTEGIQPSIMDEIADVITRCIGAAISASCWWSSSSSLPSAWRATFISWKPARSPNRARSRSSIAPACTSCSPFEVRIVNLPGAA